MFKLSIVVVLLLGCVCTNGQKPFITTREGNMTFVASNGKRIAYKIGDSDEISFDDLVKTDTQIGLLLQSVHEGAIATGKAIAGVDFIQENMSVAVTDAKIRAAIGDFEGKLQPILSNTTASIAVLESQVKMLSQSASSLYWYDTFVYIGEEPGRTFVSESSPYLNIVGVGFEDMYHPSASGQFICKFVAGGEKSESSGSLASTVSATGGEFVHLLCPLPQSWRIDTEVTVSVWSHDGSEVKFKGPTGTNTFVFGEPMFYEVGLVSKYPDPPEYMVKGTFVIGTSYKCQFIGDKGKFERTVKATSKTSLACGAGPTTAISNDVGSVKPGVGTCVLNIFVGETRIPSTLAKNIEYYNCKSAAGGVADCDTGCPIEGGGGQMLFDSPGTKSWTATFCGTVSVVAVGGGSGGGYQWSSGGGGGGGLGWIESYPVVKGQEYKVVVGKGGICGNNAANPALIGDTSYFVSLAVVAGYGAGRGGPGSAASRPYDGGGFKGDGGGRGGRGGGPAWSGGGAGAGGYTNRGGDAVNCYNGNRNCDAPAGGGGGGAGGYYSSTYGTPAGGGVGLFGKGASGKGDYQEGSEGGSGGEAGVAGQGGAGNPRARCMIAGGKFGGGGGGSGTSYGGGVGGDGGVRLVWGSDRVFPDAVPDV